MKFKTLILLGASTLAIGATSLALVANMEKFNSQIEATTYEKIYLKLNSSYWGRTIITTPPTFGAGPAEPLGRVLI